MRSILNQFSVSHYLVNSIVIAKAINTLLNDSIVLLTDYIIAMATDGPYRNILSIKHGRGVKYERNGTQLVQLIQLSGIHPASCHLVPSCIYRVGRTLSLWRPLQSTLIPSIDGLYMLLPVLAVSVTVDNYVQY